MQAIMSVEENKKIILLKLAEELFELGNEIMQNVNKDKDNDRKIFNEIGDVEKQITSLRQYMFYIQKK